MKKFLIFNADDFGYSEEITIGIIAGHIAGIVSSTSLMIDSEYAKKAADLMKKNPKLGVGLHFVADDFYNGPRFDLNNEKLVRKELERQYKKFIKLVGRKPTHIDSHHHIHKRKNLEQIFIEFSKKHNLPLRFFNQANYNGDFYGQWYDDTSQPHPFHEGISIENLEKILLSLPNTTAEIGCHPGFFTPNLKDPYNKEREIELKVFQNKKLIRLIKKLNVEIINFSDLKGVQ